MSLTVSDCGESSSRSRAHERSQLEETELQGPKKRRRSVRGRRSSVLLREGDSADCEKVVVSLNEEENASVHGSNAASKLAAVEREIAELKDYYLELQYEQKQWNELLDEKQRDVEKASRDNGPKELSSHRFARIRRSCLGDLGALHTVEGSIVNFVRKVEKNFPKNANVEVLRKEIEVAEAELAKLEAKAVTYLELLNEMSEEDMLRQIAECEQQMENARQWFRDRGLMDKFNSIVKQNIESVHSCGVTVQSRSFQ